MLGLLGARNCVRSPPALSGRCFYVPRSTAPDVPNSYSVRVDEWHVRRLITIPAACHFHFVVVGKHVNQLTASFAPNGHQPMANDYAKQNISVVAPRCKSPSNPAGTCPDAARIYPAADVLLTERPNGGFQTRLPIFRCRIFLNRPPN